MCMYVYIYAHIVYKCVCIYICIYLYTYIYIYTYQNIIKLVYNQWDELPLYQPTAGEIASIDANCNKMMQQNIFKASCSQCSPY